MINYKYKLQGDGRRSWTKTEGAWSEMVFDIEVLNWKLKAVLFQMGLLTQVENALNSLPEPNKTVAMFAWNGSPTVSITSNTTTFVQGVLNLTNDQVTDIYNQAVNIQI
jgi:hypothetical protein